MAEGTSHAADDVARGLAEREALLRVILDLTADSIVRFDEALRYDFVNDAVVKMTGRPHDEWIGRTQGELGFPPEDVAVREHRIRQVFEHGQETTYEDQITNVLGDRWYESQLFPQHDAEGRVAHVVVVSRDITDRTLARHELARAAGHDLLTGLANRRSLLHHLAETLDGRADTQHTLAVLLVDLDQFKLVNDALGHSIGDDLLCTAARRLESLVRDGELLVRHGGDEFILLIPSVADQGDALARAQSLVDAFREPLLDDGVARLSTTASVGVALAPPDRAGVMPHDLLREADTAMYAAKRAGRDTCAVFDDTLHAAAEQRLRLVNELRDAVKHKQLEVWYQPELDLTTGRIRAAEALLRWRHPSGEIVPAGRFIGVAEDTGLILTIGVAVIEEAFTQAAAWRDRGLVVRVNLAPRQLADPGLLDVIDGALDRSGADAAHLCMEITETELLEDSPVVQKNLEGIAARGLALAIDDFGTGYASLTYLRLYPVDIVKVDRTFLAQLFTNRRDLDLTAALVAFARRLGIDATAEGIEEPAQVRILRDLGCSGGQGFLFSPAVPAAELEALADGPSLLPASDPWA
jgi:diguanylate cyclase (GGDEF)-like protein/PAS domain S-box-containing protein